MYECPGCGGGLVFDIPSQMLSCSYCGTKADPYSVIKESDALEDDSFDVTVFSCPQCGGEIYSADDTAAGFCSFCGASTILDSRISRERKPRYIIPFKKTKEDCKKSYLKMMRYAPYAPRELKDPQHIDSFRGIYMPYWSYNISQIGHFSFAGKDEHRKGDYVYTDHYTLEGDLNARYEGISYDASSSFSDTISAAIAPYDISAQEDFTPSFLSGFYADTSDLDASLYEQDASNLAASESFKKICNERTYSRYGIDSDKNTKNLSAKLNNYCESTDNVMFPVWFLSYRKDDRVAYATVNGQTGKVVADLPIDQRKFLIGTLILAIPLFLLFNMLFTFRPTVSLIISAVVAIVTSFIYERQLTYINQKESGELDKGLMNNPLKKLTKSGKPRKSKKTRKPGKKAASAFKNAFLRVGITYVIIALFIGIFRSSDMVPFIILWAIMLLIAGLFSYMAYPEYKALNKGKKKLIPGFLGTFLAVFAGAVIYILHPVSDLYYYAGTIFSLAAICYTLLDLIGYYNILATRPLPQFERTGGDDRA